MLKISSSIFSRKLNPLAEIEKLIYFSKIDRNRPYQIDPKSMELLKSQYQQKINMASIQKYLEELVKIQNYNQALRESQYCLRFYRYRDINIKKITFIHDYAEMKLINIQEMNQRKKQKNQRKFRIPWFSIFTLGALAYYFYGGSEDNQQPNTFEKFLGVSDSVIIEQKNIKTRFSDVLGIDQFKQQLTELVDFLKNPAKYQSVGAKLPKGILMVGPPGTGKTLLARALAGEANCAFFYKAGSEFDEMFVGTGAKRVRALFQKARASAPSIIFIDEIDSVGGKRFINTSNDSRQTINQILAEMDGFKPSDNVIVIGATNFEQALDPAIKRPGRFDKILQIPLPDARGRKQIIQHYISKIKYDNNINLEKIAKKTVGFSGADLENMVNVSILNAVKLERKQAKQEDFQFAFDRIQMGIGRKSAVFTQKDKKLTAYHQIGHALTSLLTQGANPLHKVTILPRGGALGYTSMIPDGDVLSYTKKSIIANIDIAMGGRAAQQIFFGKDEITTGCSSDLQNATNMAYNYLRFLGMKQNFNLTSPRSGEKKSDQYNYMIDKQVQKMLAQSYERVKKILKKHQNKIHELSKKLLDEQTLTVDQIKQVLRAN